MVSKDELLETEECERCNGTGEITKAVHGREGMVPCPDCSNVPDHAIPDDLPENPKERIEEIKQEMQELEDKKQEWKSLMGDIHEAKSLLKDVWINDLINENQRAVLSHISEQISLAANRLDQDRGFMYEREAYQERIRQLETLVAYMEKDETMDEPQTDFESKCSACGVHETKEDSRYCEGCHDALLDDPDE